MTPPNRETPSTTDIQILERAIEDRDISPEEAAEVRRVLSSFNAEDIQALDENIRTQLASIIAELHPETNIEVTPISTYSLDALVAHNEWNRTTQSFIELYRDHIAGDLNEIYGQHFESLSEVGKNTVSLVFWDIMQSSLSIRGAVDVWVGRITSFTQWFTSIFRPEAIEWDSSNTEGSIITQAVRQRLSFMREQAGDRIPTATIDDFESTIDVVESLIWDQANRLNVLFEQTASLSPENRNQIFENPQVLRSILDDGTYNENGFSINLNSSPVEMQVGNVSPSALEAARDAFMEELKNESWNLWNAIERIRWLSDRADALFERLGFSGGLDEFRTMLWSIPVVGVLFKMIFWNFFDRFEQVENFEAVMRTINALQNPIRRDTMLNFHENFLPAFIWNTENANHPLTLLHRETPISENFAQNISPFFDKIDVANEAITDNTQDIRIGDREFWSRIMTGEGANENERQIFTAVSAAFSSTSFSEQALTNALNNVNIVTSSTDETTPPAAAVGEWDPADATEAEITIPEFAEATAFPFQFEGTEINYDTTHLSYTYEEIDSEFQVFENGKLAQIR